MRATRLAEQAEFIGVSDPPDVELVRWIRLDEWPETMARCMNESGYPGVTAGPDGGVEFGGIADDQREAAALAQYVCEAKYTVHPIYQVEFSADTLGRLYDYQVGPLTDCLTGRGLTVPPPPSRQAFIDGYYSDSGTFWHPYSEIRIEQNGLTEQEWLDINQACPQSPPDDELYGPMPSEGAS